MQQQLFLKNDTVLLNVGNTYSICLRGARNFNKDYVLYINLKRHEIFKAEVVSLKHLKFTDLLEKDLFDNYDIDCQDYNHLCSKMLEIYDDFDNREIVTILRFKINNKL